MSGKEMPFNVPSPFLPDIRADLHAQLSQLKSKKISTGIPKARTNINY
jgi:hypothetical protein